jgi:deoxyxylulose-5-phosphate synthase
MALSDIRRPADLRALDHADLDELAGEIRGSYFVVKGEYP